jgi:hypothetical protein
MHLVGDRTDRYVQAVVGRPGSSSAYGRSLRYVVPVVGQRHPAQKTVRKRNAVVEPVTSGVECASWEELGHVVAGKNSLGGGAARILTHMLVLEVNDDASEAKDP